MKNQYSRVSGSIELVNSLSKFYSPLFGVDLDPLTQILVTGGANGALFNAFQTFVNPGDEVIVIEPFFPCYPPRIKFAGGIPVYISLKPEKKVGSTEDWKLDFDQLESKVTSRTKAILLNNPNNPLGKVWSLDELNRIRNICVNHDLLCISDEVYEHLVYSPNIHRRIATLPDMFDRTITIGSAGKTWSVTGWKLGWAIGPKGLVLPMQEISSHVVGFGVTPVHHAIARCFDFEMYRSENGKLSFNAHIYLLTKLYTEVHSTLNDDSYFCSLVEKELRPKRDRIYQILTEMGMAPIMPEAGYFMIVDAASFKDALQDKIGNGQETWDIKCKTIQMYSRYPEYKTL